MRATTGSDDFNNWVLTEVVPIIGPYPAAPIKLEEKKQTSRLLKCACGTCGYPVRVTQQWLESAGPPFCPTDRIAISVDK